MSSFSVSVFYEDTDEFRAWLKEAISQGMQVTVWGGPDDPDQKGPMRKPTKVLYCDIDGTIRKGKDELGRFVNTAEDVEVFSDVPGLLWGYKDLGFRIVGISNQGGIALGHMDEQICAQAMIETDRQTRNAFDRLVWCPHHPDAGDPIKAVCWCRKPNIGLLVAQAFSMEMEFNEEMYPPYLGYFVGDRPEDAQCASNAGLTFLDAAQWRTGKHFEQVFADTLRPQ